MSCLPLVQSLLLLHCFLLGAISTSTCDHPIMAYLLKAKKNIEEQDITEFKVKKEKVRDQ